jgi:hypothetical protein
MREMLCLIVDEDSRHDFEPSIGTGHGKADQA